MSRVLTNFCNEFGIFSLFSLFVYLKQMEFSIDTSTKNGLSLSRLYYNSCKKSVRSSFLHNRFVLFAIQRDSRQVIDGHELTAERGTLIPSYTVHSNFRFFIITCCSFTFFLFWVKHSIWIENRLNAIHFYLGQGLTQCNTF